MRQSLRVCGLAMFAACAGIATNAVACTNGPVSAVPVAPQVLHVQSIVPGTVVVPGTVAVPLSVVTPSVVVPTVVTQAVAACPTVVQQRVVEQRIVRPRLFPSRSVQRSVIRSRF